MSTPQQQPAGAAPKVAVRVIVVDDHPVFRAGLLQVMKDAPGIDVCAEAGTVADALASAASHKPDLAIVDLSLGSESGLHLISELVAAHPTLRVLVLSGHDERVHADRALKAGALGYVMKDKAAVELLAAVRRVAAGKTYVSPETADRILSTLGTRNATRAQSPLDRLSDRERHVLTLTGSGATTRAIAERLGLSVKTVESHYAHIKQKLGIRSSRELMRAAVMWAEADHS